MEVQVQALAMEKVLPWLVISLSLLGFWLYAGGWLKKRLERTHTMTARIVGKRLDLVMGEKPSVVYYITFQMPDGKRKEMAVPGPKYGLLVENDEGRLSVKGDVFQDFKRI